MTEVIHKEEILQFLKDNKRDFEIEFRINKIGLFGSYARDEQGANSDIDLIIEFDPDTDDLTEKKERMKAIIRERFHKEVDLCREKYIKSYYKQQILQSALYV